MVIKEYRGQRKSLPASPLEVTSSPKKTLLSSSKMPIAAPSRLFDAATLFPQLCGIFLPHQGQFLETARVCMCISLSLNLHGYWKTHGGFKQACCPRYYLYGLIRKDCSSVYTYTLAPVTQRVSNAELELISSFVSQTSEH